MGFGKWKKRAVSRWGCYLILNAILAAFFAAVMVLGRSFAAMNSWDMVTAAPVRSFLSFLCYWILFFCILRAAGRPFFTEQGDGKAAPSPGRLMEKYGRKTVFLIAGGGISLLAPLSDWILPGHCQQ